MIPFTHIFDKNKQICTMKSLRIFLIIAVFLLCSKISYAQVSIKTVLDNDGITYKVYMVSKQTFTGNSSLISSSQITVVVPHGSGGDYFQFSNPTSPISNMKWVFSGRVDAPIEEPDKDYLFFNFLNNNSPVVRFDMIANQDILLFSFKRSSKCIGKVYTFDNQLDPFISPNSLGVNTGNNFTVFGAGGDAYRGNIDLPITVIISANITNPCAGSEVVFTAIPSQSGNYAYQWYVDDKVQGTPTSNPVFKYNSQKSEVSILSKISVKLIESTSNPCDAYSARKNLNVPIKGIFEAKINFGGYNCMVLPTIISVKSDPLTQYQWQENGQNIAGEKTNTLQVKKSGNYSVKTIKNSCLNTSDPLKIVGVAAADIIKVDAGKDTTILAGQSVVLKGSSDKAIDFSWTPTQSLSNPNIAQPIARPQETTKYTLTASNESGCPTTASVTINVMPLLYIPTAFSPNNDGLNDDFKIENVRFYPESTVEIYNRWGNIIFFSEGYNAAWDGQNAENATYSYIIRTKFKIYKGLVEVLR